MSRLYIIEATDSTSDRRLHNANLGVQGDVSARAQQLQGLIKIALGNGESIGVTTTDDPWLKELVTRRV